MLLSRTPQVHVLGIAGGDYSPRCFLRVIDGERSRLESDARRGESDAQSATAAGSQSSGAIVVFGVVALRRNPADESNGKRTGKSWIVGKRDQQRRAG